MKFPYLSGAVKFMSEVLRITEFVNNDLKNSFFIENPARLKDIAADIQDLIGRFAPGVIVKAGLGAGALLDILASANGSSLFVVVEPSLDAILSYIKKHGLQDNVKFINGGFSGLPVDYYRADMLICADYLDITDSGKAIYEFRRGLKFGAVFFLATVVLDDRDLEGIYDDFFREICPAHNDYYLKEDLLTFMDLNEFGLISEKVRTYRYSIEQMRGCMNKSGSMAQAAGELNAGFSSALNNFYELNGDSFTLPYFCGAFARRKPDN